MTILRDRFELLSAYLDGEVTAAERQQVRQWLDTDPQVQKLYSRLVKLRQGFQRIPIPSTSCEHQATADAVIKKDQNRQLRKWATITGGAIAATIIATLTSLLSPPTQINPQIATTPQPAPLRVALNEPVIQIPKAPDALP